MTSITVDSEEVLGRIASAWREAGRPNPVTPMPWQTRCDVPNCAGLAFAEIKTRLGQRSVCFKHFESIRSVVDADRRHKRRGRRKHS